MTTLAALRSLIAQGESETLELDRSTAELRRASKTPCAFSSGEDGQLKGFPRETHEAKASPRSRDLRGKRGTSERQ